ncbi:MAG: type II toxin-antitoxin system prevent-host-death family antitoxin [Candidatus Hydrogenedentota bacterium]
MVYVKTVEADEAEAYFLELLEEVEAGDTITITRLGVPVAMLIPVRRVDRMTREGIIEGFRKLRARNSLAGLTTKELVNDGRRI